MNSINRNNSTAPLGTEHKTASPSRREGNLSVSANGGEKIQDKVELSETKDMRAVDPSHDGASMSANLADHLEKSPLSELINLIQLLFLNNKAL